MQKIDELEQTRQSNKTSATRLATAQKELTRLTAQEKSVQSQFTGLMADNPKVEKVLTRIYKKKVVRSKKNADGDSDSNSDSDMDDMDDDEDYDDMSSDGEEIDENVCPPGCDQGVYEKVCDLSYYCIAADGVLTVQVLSLREQRASVEEALAEAKKTVDALKKDIDTLTKKEKNVQVLSPPRPPPPYPTPYSSPHTSLLTAPGATSIDGEGRQPVPAREAGPPQRAARGGSRAPPPNSASRCVALSLLPSLFSFALRFPFD